MVNKLIHSQNVKKGNVMTCILFISNDTYLNWAEKVRQIFQTYFVSSIYKTMTCLSAVCCHGTSPPPAVNVHTPKCFDIYCDMTE